MNNDLERVTQMAEECGADAHYYNEEFDGEGRLVPTFVISAEELLAFEQAVLAKRNEEIELHKKNSHAFQNLYLEAIAKLAMQFDILKRASTSLGAFCSDEGWSQEDMDVLDSVDAVLCSDINSYVVDAWIAEHDKKLLDEAFVEPVAWMYPVVNQNETSIPLYCRKELK